MSIGKTIDCPLTSWDVLASNDSTPTQVQSFDSLISMRLYQFGNQTIIRFFNQHKIMPIGESIDSPLAAWDV